MKKFVLTTVTADPNIEKNLNSSIYDEESMMQSDFKEFVKDLNLDQTLTMTSYGERFNEETKRLAAVRWTTTITRIA